jgi:hypothetical protein
MKTRLAYLAACAAVALLVAGKPAPLAAQPVFYPGSPAVLPPHEILTIVRSVGLEPLGRPLRSGETYGLRAVSPAGQVVHVVVHARMGRVLRVTPATRAAGLSPPNPIPYPPPGAMVPDGYGPNSRIAGYPPEMSDIPYAERGSDWATPPVRSAKPNPAPLPRARPAPSPLPREADAASTPSTPAPSVTPGADPSTILE